MWLSAEGQAASSRRYSGCFKSDCVKVLEVEGIRFSSQGSVTWKEAAEALLTLAADDMWVRGGTKQKMVAGPGLSGLAGGGRRKQTLFLCGHIFVL